MRHGPQFLLVALAFFLCGGAQRAQAQALQAARPSMIELDAGYSFLSSSFAGNGTRFNISGFDTSVVFNVNPWLSFAGDMALYREGNVAHSGLGLSISTYQAGLRLRLHNHTNWTPFAEMLAGIGHAGGTLYTTSLTPDVAPLGANNGLLVTLGGGLDRKLTPWFSIRLIEADYIHSEFLNGSGNGNRQNLYRLGGGLTFSFVNR